MEKKIIKLLELKPNGITLEMPEKSCQVGHMLTLFIFLAPYKKKIRQLPKGGTPIPGSLDVIGKVSAIESMGEESGKISVEITLTQFDEVRWNNLVKKYQKRQDDIDNLAEAAKY